MPISKVGVSTKAVIEGKIVKVLIEARVSNVEKVLT